MRKGLDLFSVVKNLRFVLLFVGIVAALPFIYLGASQVGSLIPRDSVALKFDNQPKTHRVYLLNGLLHADIAIKVDETLRRKFDFLDQSTLPMQNPILQYLAFGWGSKAFYTTAGTYSDIKLPAVFKAMTGDESVMRVTAFGDISSVENNIVITLNDQQYLTLLKSIRSSFAESRTPVQMQNVSIGGSDAFYAAKGPFNIFYPCNQWVGRVLHESGVGVGLWTPTTYTLRQSLSVHGAWDES